MIPQMVASVTFRAVRTPLAIASSDDSLAQVGEYDERSGTHNDDGPVWPIRELKLLLRSRRRRQSPTAAAAARIASMVT